MYGACRGRREDRYGVPGLRPVRRYWLLTNETWSPLPILRRNLRSGRVNWASGPFVGVVAETEQFEIVESLVMSFAWSDLEAVKVRSKLQRIDVVKRI